MMARGGAEECSRHAGSSSSVLSERVSIIFQLSGGY